MAPDNSGLIRDIQGMIQACIVADDAQQRFADAHVVTEPDEVSDALYNATYELVHYINNMIGSVEWENMMLGLQEEN